MKTNFDKIKAMSSGEFADFLATISDCCYTNDTVGICPENCPLIGTDNCGVEGLKKWLESEVGDL